MVVLLMPHLQPLLHELFSPLGSHAEARWVAGPRGVVSKDLPHPVKQADGRIQKIFGRKLRNARYG